MTRRRFLQRVAGVGAYLAGGKTFTRVIAEALPGGGIGLAPAGAAMIDNATLAAGCGVTAMPMTAAYILWRKLEDAERSRSQWYGLWRLHRIRVRRLLENPQPAKIVW